MRIIDLTLPLYTGMPVYPGDPEVSIELVQTHEKEGWNMRRIQVNGHDGTHVNAPIHMVAGGKTLSEMRLDAFCGPAKIYNGTLEKHKGVIFRDQNIDAALAEKIKKVRPLFVGLSNIYEFDVEIEKDLLANDILVFERLANLDKVPNEFMFYGMPLNIKDGDGSPVRAFGVVDDHVAAFSMPEIEIAAPENNESKTENTHNSWLQNISFTIGGITIGAAAVFGLMQTEEPVCLVPEVSAPQQTQANPSSTVQTPPRKTSAPTAATPAPAIAAPSSQNANTSTTSSADGTVQ